MKNIINSPIKGLDIECIDKLLPFEKRGVWIWHVSFKKTGYGHWQLVMDIDIDERKIILSCTITNSQMIDYWDGLTEEVSGLLPLDYQGRTHAINDILGANEDTLLDFIAAREEEEQEMFNIE